MSTEAKKKQKGVSFFSSIKGKVAILIIAFITVAVAAMLVLVLPTVRSSMKNLTQNYLYDLTVAGGERVEIEASAIGMEATLDLAVLKPLVENISLQGIDSSYAYVVGADGTMLYHPTESKIGEPVENAVVTGVVADIKAGKVPGPAVVAYEFKGVTKYAGYYVNPTADFILVVSADEDEIMKPIDNITNIGVICAIVIVIICSAFGYVAVGRMVNPIVKVTGIINKLADMDFTEDDDLKKLNMRKDETGIMSRAIGVLRGQLVDVVGGLKTQSELIYEASNSLDNNASETAETVEQVEKAVSEISDGATSQADETQKATENVILMGNMVEEASREVDNLIANANEMKASSDEATSTLYQLEQINKQAKEAIDIIYEQTNITNESALKIREATELITSIAEETNLLSLNASIEAARAGEQGRGFAVVASQIQKLAEQSNESAHQIENITDSLITDSEKAVQTMGEVKEIMNKQSEHVAKTDEIFTQVKNGIDNSIAGVNAIADKTKQMDNARVNVVDVVQNLTAIAEENAASTQETSASVTEVSNIVYHISENATKMKDVANELEQNMNIFKL
ncbi:MAG: methyl-accepting chemotaxis protein [Lachnospiraceae bacterium]|nr:methyl-accepting chemotaxis protein [Lachnospiraceae bacterium]